MKRVNPIFWGKGARLGAWTSALSLCLLMGSCALKYPHPHSQSMGEVSPYSGRPWRLPAIHFPESFFSAWPTEQGFRYVGAETKSLTNPIQRFGFLPLEGSVYLDQTEVPIAAYREFVYDVSRNSEVSFEHLLPNLSGAADSLYLNNPRFLMHPMVGVSQEQARAYCTWRAKKINLAIQEDIALGGTRYLQKGEQMEVSARLPTRAEWQKAASGGLDTTIFTYGYNTLLLEVDFDEQAVAYLHDRFWFDLSQEQISAELEGFTLAKNRLPAFNLWWPYAPEVLQSPIPGYVYSYQPNALGFFHLIGNVREWVADDLYTMGGSFADPMSSISLQKGIEEPSGHSVQVGFRCACEIEYIPRS